MLSASEKDLIFTNLLKKSGNFHEVEGQSFKEQYLITYSYLDAIVSSCPTDSYSFILAITNLEEHFDKDILGCCQSILNNYALYFADDGILAASDAISHQIAFSAFYYCCLYDARYKKEKEFKDLIFSEERKYFTDEPLYFEMLARYAQTIKDFEMMSLIALLAQKKYDQKNDNNGLPNVALFVTYIASLTSIMESLFLKGTIYKESPEKKKTCYSSGLKEEELIKALKESKGHFDYDSSFLKDVFPLALKEINQAIGFNPNYPKYYYLKAELQFFQSLYENDMISKTKKEEVKDLLSSAYERLDRKSPNLSILKEEYQRFETMVDSCAGDTSAWHSSATILFERKKNEIDRSLKRTDDIEPLSYENGSSAPHVFISYSSSDYRQVYCDILELTKEGILCDYDRDMNVISENSSESEKQKWYIAAEQKISSSSLVLCFLSASYLISKPVLKELQFIDKHHKQVVVIDLSGKKRISSLISSVIRSGLNLDSKALFWYTKLINDDNNIIPRDLNPLSNRHIPPLKERVAELDFRLINSLKGEMISKENTGMNHPMEDVSYIDEHNSIYVVADGITHSDRTEYSSEESFPYLLAKTFVENFGKYLGQVLENWNGRSDIRVLAKEAFTKANDDIRKLNEVNSDKMEVPGAVVAFGFVINASFYYGAVGDPSIYMYRESSRIELAPPQTYFAFKEDHVEKDREKLVKEYVNKPSNPHGYGVVNGDKECLAFLNISHVHLEHDDVICLSSDGFDKLLRFGKVSDIENKSLKALLKESTALNKKMTGKDTIDDRILIRLSWKER